MIRIFPNRDSVLRLVGALLMEQDEVWTTGKRYFDMATSWQWRGRQPIQSPLFSGITGGADAPTRMSSRVSQRPHFTDEFGLDRVKQQ